MTKKKKEKKVILVDISRAKKNVDCLTPYDFSSFMDITPNDNMLYEITITSHRILYEQLDGVDRQPSIAS